MYTNSRQLQIRQLSLLLFKLLFLVVPLETRAMTSVPTPTDDRPTIPMSPTRRPLPPTGRPASGTIRSPGSDRSTAASPPFTPRTRPSPLPASKIEVDDRLRRVAGRARERVASKQPPPPPPPASRRSIDDSHGEQQQHRRVPVRGPIAAPPAPEDLSAVNETVVGMDHISTYDVGYADDTATGHGDATYQSDPAWRPAPLPESLLLIPSTASRSGSSATSESGHRMESAALSGSGQQQQHRSPRYYAANATQAVHRKPDPAATRSSSSATAAAVSAAAPAPGGGGKAPTLLRTWSISPDIELSPPRAVGNDVSVTNDQPGPAATNTPLLGQQPTATAAAAPPKEEVPDPMLGYSTSSMALPLQAMASRILLSRRSSLAASMTDQEVDALLASSAAVILAAAANGQIPQSGPGMQPPLLQPHPQPVAPPQPQGGTKQHSTRETQTPSNGDDGDEADLWEVSPMEGNMDSYALPSAANRHQPPSANSAAAGVVPRGQQPAGLDRALDAMISARGSGQSTPAASDAVRFTPLPVQQLPLTVDRIPVEDALFTRRSSIATSAAGEAAAGHRTLTGADSDSKLDRLLVAAAAHGTGSVRDQLAALRAEALSEIETMRRDDARRGPMPRSDATTHGVTSSPSAQRSDDALLRMRAAALAELEATQREERQRARSSAVKMPWNAQHSTAPASTTTRHSTAPTSAVKDSSRSPPRHRAAASRLSFSPAADKKNPPLSAAAAMKPAPAQADPYDPRPEPSPTALRLFAAADADGDGFIRRNDAYRIIKEELQERHPASGSTMPSSMTLVAIPAHRQHPAHCPSAATLGKAFDDASKETREVRGASAGPMAGPTGVLDARGLQRLLDAVTAADGTRKNAEMPLRHDPAPPPSQGGTATQQERLQAPVADALRAFSRSLGRRSHSRAQPDDHRAPSPQRVSEETSSRNEPSPQPRRSQQKYPEDGSSFAAPRQSPQRRMVPADLAVEHDHGRSVSAVTALSAAATGAVAAARRASSSVSTSLSATGGGGAAGGAAAASDGYTYGSSPWSVDGPHFSTIGRATHHYHSTTPGRASLGRQQTLSIPRPYADGSSTFGGAHEAVGDPPFFESRRLWADEQRHAATGVGMLRGADLAADAYESSSAATATKTSATAVPHRALTSPDVARQVLQDCMAADRNFTGKILVGDLSRLLVHRHVFTCDTHVRQYLIQGGFVAATAGGRQSPTQQRSMTLEEVDYTHVLAELKAAR
jgi:hypothetical protein